MISFPFNCLLQIALWQNAYFFGALQYLLNGITLLTRQPIHDGACWS